MMDTANDFDWPDGKQAAVSLSFDDARLTQADVGLDLLDRHGVKATFYVMQRGFEKRLDRWRQAVADGHEMGNHSIHHPCTGNLKFARNHALESYTLDDMRREMDEASDLIEQRLGVRPTTFGYPCYQTWVGRGANHASYVPLVAERFVVGRHGRNETVNDPAFCDLALAAAIDLDQGDWDLAKRWIDKALDRGGWLIFSGHEIADQGTQATRPDVLEKLCEYCTAPAHGVWIDTIDAVGAYIRDHRVSIAP